jgi:phosphonate transport system permease protein
MSEDTGGFHYADPSRAVLGAKPLRFSLTLLIVLLIYGLSCYFVDIDPERLWTGLPRLAHWLAKAWPPDIRDVDVLLRRAAETVAMAVVGTTIGVVIAAPFSVLAARNIPQA